MPKYISKEHKEKRITLDQLFTIIGQVESGNDDTATGDNGKSIGRYQIQKAYYTDALQYEPGLRKYKYHQMRNHKIAQRVMIAYFQRYAKKWTAEEKIEAIELHIFNELCHDILKQAAILQAEGLRQSEILQAEGNQQATVLKADGFSTALDRIYQVASTIDAKTMSLQYFETLKSLGASPSTKWIFPMEFTSMLSPFLGMGSGQSKGGGKGESS